MKSNEIVAALAPFTQMANKHALSLNYKVLSVSPGMVRACSAYGILDAEIALGANASFVIDATSFVAVMKSLPSATEVELEVKGDALHWQCDMASGKLALIKADVTIPPIPDVTTDGWEVTANFITALSLGALSCGDASLASAGVFGIVLDNRQAFSVYATDDITVSSCTLGAHIEEFPEQIVLSPDACKLLHAVLSAGEKPVIAVSEKTVHLSSDPFNLYLRAIPPLKQDIAALRDAFSSSETTATIPHVRVAAFVKRATALAESARHTYVDISAASGALSLSFHEDKAASEEYYLAEGLEVPDLPPIRVDAARLARALAYTNTIVLDHIERGVLVLTGGDPLFSYMLAGKKEAKK